VQEEREDRRDWKHQCFRGFHSVNSAIGEIAPEVGFEPNLTTK